MDNRCKVCCHPSSLEINNMILEKISLSKISKRFGMSKTSISRHKKNHMVIQENIPSGTKKTTGTQVPATQIAGTTTEQLEQLKQLTQRLLVSVTANKAVPIPQAIALMKEHRAQLSDIEKTAPKQQFRESLEDNGEWIEFRDLVLDALRDHPDAKADVLQALDTNTDDDTDTLTGQLRAAS